MKKHRQLRICGKWNVEKVTDNLQRDDFTVLNSRSSRVPRSELQLSPFQWEILADNSILWVHDTAIKEEVKDPKLYVNSTSHVYPKHKHRYP